MIKSILVGVLLSLLLSGCNPVEVKLAEEVVEVVAEDVAGEEIKEHKEHKK